MLPFVSCHYLCRVISRQKPNFSANWNSTARLCRCVPDTFISFLWWQAPLIGLCFHVIVKNRSSWFATKTLDYRAAMPLWSSRTSVTCAVRLAERKPWLSLRIGSSIPSLMLVLLTRRLQACRWQANRRAPHRRRRGAWQDSRGLASAAIRSACDALLPASSKSQPTNDLGLFSAIHLVSSTHPAGGGLGGTRIGGKDDNIIASGRVGSAPVDNREPAPLPPRYAADLATMTIRH